METVLQAKPMFGSQLYQIRAQKALPILVRQALAQKTIYYSDLALEMDMPNPRNLNFVLGSVGQTLIELEKKWSEKIPMIQGLVINKTTQQPGEGIDEFLSDINFRNLSEKQQRAFIERELQKVFLYQKWSKVLKELGLKSVQSDFTTLNKKASNFYGGGGEGEEHKKLKMFVADNPTLFGLPASISPGEIEYSLPSGDSLDVFFSHRKKHIGIEVKSHISDSADITRGLYQCIKYQAVLEARQAANGQPQNVRTFLVLGGEFPDELLALKNVLGVTVLDKINHM